MQLINGTSLQGGKYRIESVLGQGGFGITYLATHTMLGSKVAIKEFFFKDCCERMDGGTTMSVPTKSNMEIVERFKSKFIKEAQTVFQLKHDNIVRIYDIFEENSTAYYVMEYIDNGSLSDVIKKEGRMDEARVLKYTHQIALALGYIHDHNVLHLDVKPANILLRKDDTVVLIDFGVSKRYDESGGQTSTTPAGISKGYAPIEQYKQGGLQSFAPCTDIYSLGATMYKMLTGTTPPEASDVAEDGLPQMPSCISVSTRKAVIEAMKPRKKDRPQSITAFLAMLPKEVKQIIEEDNPIEEEPSDDEETIVDMNGIPDSDNDEETYLDDEDDENKDKKKKIIILAIVVLAIVGGWMLYNGNQTDVNSDDTDSSRIGNVVGMEDSVGIETEHDQKVKLPEKKPFETPINGTSENNENKQNKTESSPQITSSSTSNSIKPAAEAEEIVDDSKVYDVVEQMPSFPGGQQNLFNYLSSHINYPAAALENGIQGRVICTFVVEKNGSIGDVKVVKSVDPSLDKEAVRVIRNMPNWNAGKQNGLPVRVKYTVPVTFRAQ